MRQSLTRIGNFFIRGDGHFCFHNTDGFSLSDSLVIPVSGRLFGWLIGKLSCGVVLCGS